jgi:hypothetical protein
MAADGEVCRPSPAASTPAILWCRPRPTASDSPASRPGPSCLGRPRPPRRRATGFDEDGGPAARSCRGRRARWSRRWDGPWLPGAPRVLFLPWRSFLRWQLLAGAISAAVAMALEAGACRFHRHWAENPHRPKAEGGWRQLGWPSSPGLAGGRGLAGAAASNWFTQAAVRGKEEKRRIEKY